MGARFLQGLRPSGEVAFRRLPDPPQQAQDQVLAVGFEEEGVLVLAEGGFDEDVAQFRLERGVDVDLGLFDGDPSVDG